MEGTIRPTVPGRTKPRAREVFDRVVDTCNGLRQVLGAEPQQFSPRQQARLDEIFNRFDVEEMYDAESGAGRREYRQSQAVLRFDPKAAAERGVPPDCLAFRVTHIDSTTIWSRDGFKYLVKHDLEGRPVSVLRRRPPAAAATRWDPDWRQRTIAGSTCSEVAMPAAAVVVPTRRCLWNRYAGRFEKNLPLPLEVSYSLLGDEHVATAVEVRGLPPNVGPVDRMPPGIALHEHVAVGARRASRAIDDERDDDTAWSSR